MCARRRPALCYLTKIQLILRFLTSYEEAWTKVHEKIAKLYEDNELTKDEQKLEEDYKVELEELNGALEDYENSLKELQADIEAYEESLYEMYDNKVE